MFRAMCHIIVLALAPAAAMAVTAGDQPHVAKASLIRFEAAGGDGKGKPKGRKPMRKVSTDVCALRCANQCAGCVKETGVNRTEFYRQVRGNGCSTEFFETKCSEACDKLLDITDKYFRKLRDSVGKSSSLLAVSPAAEPPAVAADQTVQGELMSLGASGYGSKGKQVRWWNVLCKNSCLDRCATCLRKSGFSADDIDEMRIEEHHSLKDIKGTCSRDCRRFTRFVEAPVILVESRAF
mmetsp:Transcript_117377/g.230334  ORF Transcript_117377/g.230334 Transcript_117377/m.230334 type:complete len:238 (-) Transcript_117377:116-829(-)